MNQIKSRVLGRKSMSEIPPGKRALNVAIREDLIIKFRAFCKKERRPQTLQMEIILEKFFREQKSKEIKS